MASINGLCLKGVTKFLGHEGEPLYQGNLYLNNKKIAFWSQDSHGGPDNFVFKDGYKTEKLLNDIIKALYPEKAIHSGTPENPFDLEYELSDLITDVLDLMSDEKSFKKAVKAGYEGIIVATDGFHQVIWNLPKSYTVLSDEVLFDKLSVDINNAKETFFAEDEFRKHTVKIYRSLNDFVIGEPIKLDKTSVDKLLSDAKLRALKDETVHEPIVVKDDVDLS